jgi:hypothetical protein
MKKQEEEITKGVKGFDKNLKCRNFQFKEGETYEESGDPVRCEHGFHFCENPLDVFGYYPPADSVYHKVEGLGKSSRDDDDSKVAVSKIKIGINVSLHDLINDGIKFIFKRTKLTKEKTNTTPSLQASNSRDSGAASNSGYSGAASNSGDSGAASNSGYRGAASNSGYRGAASNSGYSGAASNSGDSGAASNSGDSGAASNSGDSGAASNSGDSGAASNSGYRGAASNSGYRGAASNSGDRGAASNSGYRGAAFSIGTYSSAATLKDNTIACAVGYQNKASGSLGAWIVLAEWNDDGEVIKSVKTAKVDGKTIKADTFYTLKKGKFVKAT